MKKLITKLFTETITEEEIDELHILLNNPKNQEVLESFVRDYYDLNLATLKSDIDAAYKKVNSVIETKEKPVRKLFNYWKYAVAASIVLLISFTFIFNKDNSEGVEPIIVNNNIKTGTDKATLTLEDGSEVVLEKGQNYISDHLSSNGEELIYKLANSPKPEITYNYLTIPRGGQYQVELSDGTKVWLNSETKLKYPVNFINGQAREVELIYGEAYFEVSPSTVHNGAKFKVLNSFQNIEVLGTKFNIKAYQDEDNIYTSLVEGAVSVDNSVSKTPLSPNQQSVLNINNKDIIVTPINALAEISWIHGDFVFERKSLSKIAKVLSRWYDVEVIFMDKTLEKIEFTGELSKNQNIEEILILINNTNIISAYEINNNTILIK
ncbi:FecR family protein [Flavivirga sp. 57AJ16]|uniref:FecR family protein n=1 Tax=Flavivirga sp. 57AJ16 TaxID=3025307 RepID=UPI0023660B65|nr:FecR domain-containing protein [Flavivirga sp. 57AJ16]MDD7885490.1 DUF4974 domain-containing protein [Flavivirga sp. 57AJ16]